MSDVTPRIREILKAKGATYISRTFEKRAKYTLSCSCGKEFSVRMDYLYSERFTGKCSDCSLIKVTTIRRNRNLNTQLTRLKQKCNKYGATLIEKSYLNTVSNFQFICRCGKSYQRQANLVIFYEDRRVECDDCSKEYSHQIAKRGSQSPNWNPNLTPEDRLKKRDPFESCWRKAVYEKAQWCCELTGLKGKLSAHHIYNWGHYPHMRIFLRNGISILNTLHDEFHKEFGRGHNTYQQLKDFASSRGLILLRPDPYILSKQERVNG